MIKNSTALFSTTVFWIRNLSYSVLLVALTNLPVWSNTVELRGKPQLESEKEQITLKIRVLNDKQKPIPDLYENNFKVVVDDNEDQEISFTQFLLPQQVKSYPAYIIVLLDLTGSMNQQDTSGLTRVEGAIQAIRQLNKITDQRGGDTSISIVPFGKGGNGCSGFEVNENTLNNFNVAGDAKIDTYLNNLGNPNATPICATTDLYNPLLETVRFLTNKSNPAFYPPTPESNQTEPIQPALSIILLSDGYHNQGNEEQLLNTLKDLLAKNPQITIHTLGYGLTPEELQKKYNLSAPATRADLVSRDKLVKGKVPEDEFIDKEILAQIAQLTGGIAEFSPDARNVAENLNLFMDAILGYYQITYIEPNPDRGTKHNVYVEVTDNNAQTIGQSDLGQYTMLYFGRLVPFGQRIPVMITIGILIVFGGIIPFLYWGKKIKEEN
jgi:hypothetical protein